MGGGGGVMHLGDCFLLNRNPDWGSHLAIVDIVFCYLCHPGSEWGAPPDLTRGSRLGGGGGGRGKGQSALLLANKSTRGQ